METKSVGEEVLDGLKYCTLWQFNVAMIIHSLFLLGKSPQININHL